MLSLGTTVEHDLNARRELAIQRAADFSSREIFSTSWSESLVAPSRTLKSSRQESAQEFEVAGSLTQAIFSVELRTSAYEYLQATGEALGAPVLTSAEQRLRDAAKLVDEVLEKDAKRRQEEIALEAQRLPKNAAGYVVATAA